MLGEVAYKGDSGNFFKELTGVLITAGSLGVGGEKIGSRFGGYGMAGKISSTNFNSEFFI